VNNKIKSNKIMNLLVSECLYHFVGLEYIPIFPILRLFKIYLPGVKVTLSHQNQATFY